MQARLQGRSQTGEKQEHFTHSRGRGALEGLQRGHGAQRSWRRLVLGSSAPRDPAPLLLLGLAVPAPHPLRPLSGGPTSCSCAPEASPPAAPTSSVVRSGRVPIARSPVPPSGTAPLAPPLSRPRARPRPSPGPSVFSGASRPPSRRPAETLCVPRRPGLVCATRSCGGAEAPGETRDRGVVSSCRGVGGPCVAAPGPPRRRPTWPVSGRPGTGVAGVGVGVGGSGVVPGGGTQGLTRRGAARRGPPGDTSGPVPLRPLTGPLLYTFSFFKVGGISSGPEGGEIRWPGPDQLSSWVPEASAPPSPPGLSLCKLWAPQRCFGAEGV